MSRNDADAERLAVLETGYQARLVAALRECAAGRWGLFGHNIHLTPHASEPEAVEDLAAMADTIAQVRDRLGLPPYSLHDDFMAARGPAQENAPGEPKQARAWLARLEAEA